MAHRVPGSWGSLISRRGCSPKYQQLLRPRKYSWYSFLLEAIVRQEGLCQWKIPMTPSGIEPATFRLVTQCLNQLHRWQALIIRGEQNANHQHDLKFTQPGNCLRARRDRIAALLVPAGAGDNDSKSHVSEDVNLKTVAPCRRFNAWFNFIIIESSNWKNGEICNECLPKPKPFEENCMNTNDNVKLMEKY